MNIRELFRSKLENSELIPDGSVRNELMRKLAVREFLSFNPLKFNIYYAGGLAAAALATLLIFTKDPSPGQFQNGKTGQEAYGSADSVSLVNPGKQVSAESPSRTRAKDLKTVAKRPSEKSESGIATRGIDNKTIVRKGDSTAVNVDSLKKRAVFPDNLSDKSNIAVLQKTISAAYSSSVTGGCLPLRVRFLNKSSSFDSCRWVFGDGGFSNEKNPEWIFDVAGEYRIVLNVFRSDGAHAIASSVIVVHPRPVARFEIAPEKPVIPYDAIRFVNYSVDAVRYKWEFGDGNSSNAFEPDHKYRKYSNYDVRLIVWSEFGCSDSMLVRNAFASSGCFINFPNAFIPGSDGPSGGFYSTKSDEAARIFHPVSSGVSEFQLRIFSKQGILIFESNDISIGWDGYLKGQLCEPGVYVWKVRGTFTNGEPFVKMGDITLLKN